jgi:hypothetical protein
LAAAVAPTSTALNESASSHLPTINAQEQVHSFVPFDRLIILQRAQQNVHLERLLRTTSLGTGSDKNSSALQNAIHLATITNVQAPVPTLHRALFNHGETQLVFANA